MRLHEIIAGLSECPAESLIFAQRIGGEFRPESAAVIIELSEAEFCRPVSEVAVERAPGMEYFLEAFIVLEMLGDWRCNHTKQRQDLDAIVERIIYYAEHDA